MGKIIIYKDHAVIRMLEREISQADVLEVLDSGEIIEEYKDDYPYPSCLMFKMVNKRPLHVVVASDENDGQSIVITVYIPDLAKFEPDFKTRKKII